MKNLILFTIVGFVLSVSSAVADTTFSNDAVPDPVVTSGSVLEGYRTSSNVVLIAKGSTASYNAVAGHEQGDTMYGSSAGDSVIYKTDKVAGDAVVAADCPAIPATSTDTTGFTAAGWTTL